MGKPPRHRNPPKAAHLASQSPIKPSLSSGSLGSAPSSVMLVQASPLSRDLSDLSGSYMNGNTAPRASRANYSVCSTEDPVQGFWRQAFLLSTPCPKEYSSREPPTAATNSASPALIVVERNGVIELVKKGDQSESDQEKTSEGGSNDSQDDAADDESDIFKQLQRGFLHDRQGGGSKDLLFLSHGGALEDDAANRIPILILLMDPGRKQYEIMQLWVDPLVDLVRDVLHALQRKLSDKWRQDYDGLFQLRGEKFCQLVHILSIAKYDVRPRELWVAKPWSMAAKTTTELAKECVQQLEAGGLLAPYATNVTGKSRVKGFLKKGSGERTCAEMSEQDAPLTLSEDALKRLYVPDGSMNHHHACQFLSFKTPAIPSRVLGGHVQGHKSANGFFGSLLRANNSFDDGCSQLTNPSDILQVSSSADLSHSKLNTSSCSGTISPKPTHSPGKRQHSHHHGAGGYSSRHLHRHQGWNSQLEAVGELAVGSNNNQELSCEQQQQEESNMVTSQVLADLEEACKQQAEPASKSKECGESRDINSSTVKNNQRRSSSLMKMLKPLNCANCRSKNQEAGDSYDEFDSKSGSSNRNSSRGSRNQDDNGRDTPTSRGSADETFLISNIQEERRKWKPKSTKHSKQRNSWEGAEDGSIVSDSAPLLKGIIGSTSSVATNSPILPQEQQPEIQHHEHHQHHHQQLLNLHPTANKERSLVRPVPRSRLLI